MARSKRIKEQMNEIKLEEEPNSYQATVSRMRKKGMKTEMLVNFFSTVQSLATMDSTTSSTVGYDEDDQESHDGGYHFRTARQVIEDKVVNQSFKNNRPPTPGPAVGEQEPTSSDDDDVQEESKKLNWRKYDLLKMIKEHCAN